MPKAKKTLMERKEK